MVTPEPLSDPRRTWASPPPTVSPEAAHRLEAFWSCASADRPALCVRARDPNYREEPWPGPDPPCKQLDLRPDWQRHLARQRLGRLRHYAESTPELQVAWGSMLVTLPVLAGGDYAYEGGGAWILPADGVYDRPLPVFDPNTPIARRLTACYDAIREEAGDRAVVCAPLMLDGLTSLAMMRGTDRLVMDLHDRPDDVASWAAAMNRMFVDIYDYYYRRLGYGWSVCFGGPSGPGPSDALQCDFAVMISPGMFATFVLDDLKRVGAYMSRTLYHLDGVEQMRFLDMLVTIPNLRGIQWNPQTTYARGLSRLDDLREIRRRGMALMINCHTPEEALELTDALGPEGLFLRFPEFPTPHEAEAAMRLFGAR
jgi:hypothetical protein